MLYLVVGANEAKASARYEALVKHFSENGKRVTYRVNSLDFTPTYFAELALGLPLFGETFVVACNKIFENKDATEWISTHIKEIVLSPHHFIILEQKIPSGLGGIEKYGGFIEEFNLAEDRKKGAYSAKGYNVFAVTDCLGRRDRKALWVELQKAKMAGLSPEEVFWKLVWQAKNLILAKNTKTAKEAGVSPFPYAKAKSLIKNFSAEDLGKLLERLVRVYHDARRGIGDLETGLELFALSL